jgi:hypothetical protein
MADDGLPSGYKYATPTPKAATMPQATAPAAPTGLPSGYRPAPPPQQQTVKPPAPPAAQATGPAGNLLSIMGPGWDPLPQSADDWTTRFANDVLLHASPTLRAQSAQADPRMSMAAKVTADTAGQLNPTQLLNRVPVVGPALQGAVQEGVRSYMDGRQGWDLASDTGKGALAGLLSMGITSPEVIKHAATVGVPAAAGYLWGGDLSHLVGGGMAGRMFLDPMAEALKARIGQINLPSLPPSAAQAVQNLIMGPASTLIQDGRGNPQPPPQPGFGYPGN